MSKVRNKAKRIILQTLFFIFYASLTAVLLLSAVILGAASSLVYKNHQYKNRVFPNVHIQENNLSGLNENEILTLWNKKNDRYRNLLFEFHLEDQIATISAKDLQIGYNAQLIARQSLLIGRSGNFLADSYVRLLSPKMSIIPTINFNEEIVRNTIATLADSVDLPAQDARFTFQQNRVTEFKPSTPGKRVNRSVAYQQFTNMLSEIPSKPNAIYPIIIPVEVVQPKIATAHSNSFGIKEKIGEGYSQFSGSIPGRIHNVLLSAAKLNGVIIPPGEIISYNNLVGDISAATGFQQAYIIKDGRTVLGDGGGVCQTSTTLFRAALSAGLPIVERRGHAYRVHYYEEGGFKPGIDATVFAPSVDLKIKNDTPGYILIQTKADIRIPSLTIELYGTSDGRVSVMYNHKVYNEAPPPPPLYQDDPTLPKGTVKQVDFAAWGANAVFSYKVTRNGETLINQDFVTVYRPWQAVYLKGPQ